MTKKNKKRRTVKSGKKKLSNKTNSHFLKWLLVGISLTIIYFFISKKILRLDDKYEFLSFIPLSIVLLSYFLRKNKLVLTSFSIIMSSLFIIVITNLHNPFIHKIQNFWKYYNVGSRLSIPNQGIDDFSFLLSSISNKCLSPSEANDTSCLLFLEKIIKENEVETIRQEVQNLEEKIKNYEEQDTLNEYHMIFHYLEYSKKILRLEPSKADKYLLKGINLAKKIDHSPSLLIFKYYLAVSNYLQNNMGKAQQQLKELINEGGDENFIRIIAHYTLLQIKKNNYEFSGQEDFEEIKWLIRECKKLDYDIFEFLSVILRGDFYMQRVFFNLSKQSYIDALNLQERIKDKNILKGIEGRFYSRLGHSYLNRGGIDRAGYYFEKSEQSGIFWGGEYDVEDFFIVDFQFKENFNTVSYFMDVIELSSHKRMIASSLMPIKYWNKNKNFRRQK